MTVVYAPGVTVTDHLGGSVKIGDVSDPGAFKVRTTAPAKPQENPFTKWVNDELLWQATVSGVRDACAAKQAETPAPAEGGNKERAEGGNKEREVVFRTVVALEKALAELPKGHAQVAGFLQGKAARGGLKAEDNALAFYLAGEVRRRIERENPGMTLSPTVTIWVESNGTIVESPNYQVAMEPQIWQNMFISLLRAGHYPALLW